jgi:hypothetical protein
MLFKNVIMFSISCALLLLGAFAEARDVVPDEKMGQLQVLNVHHGDWQPVADKSVFDFTFIIDKARAEIDLDKVNDVAAGVGCLTIDYRGRYGKYKASQCGIRIDEHKLTTVQLGAVKFTWDLENFAADFGPQPVFNFSTTESDRSFIGFLNPADPGHLKENFFLIPPMTLTRTLSHDATGVLFQDKIAVNADMASIEQMPSQDFLGQILLDFFDGKPSFDTRAPRNVIVASYGANNTQGNKAHAPAYIEEKSLGRQNAEDGRYNFYKFSVLGENQTVHAYPLLPNAKNAAYEVSINEHVIIPVLEPGKVFRIPIATLDVHNYKSSLPGKYKVYSDRDQKGVLAEYKPKMKGYRNLESVLFPTETSLFFPIGHTFRLDFYATDDLGRDTLQDQVLVDLTHE